MNLYLFLIKAYELLEKNGWICIENIHIHNEKEDYARVTTLYRKEKGIRKQTSLSGGKQEAVWNTYESEYNNFIEAFSSIININNVNELADAIYTIYSFEERWNRISFNDLCKLDTELCIYCNSRS